MERIPSAARLVAVVVATMLMALPRIALACDGAVTVCPEPTSPASTLSLSKSSRLSARVS